MVVLAIGTPIGQGDVLATGEDATLTVTFADDTRFSLGAGARMVVDEFVYNPDGGSGTAAFDLLQGVFGFVSGDVAHSGPDAMTISTPVATIGIRGTALALRIAPVGERSLISLLADPDGDLGSVTVTTNADTVVLDDVDVNEATTLTSLDETPGSPSVLTPARLIDVFGAILALLGLVPGWGKAGQPGAPGSGGEGVASGVGEELAAVIPRIAVSLAGLLAVTFAGSLQLIGVNRILELSKLVVAGIDTPDGRERDTDLNGLGDDRDDEAVVIIEEPDPDLGTDGDDTFVGSAGSDVFFGLAGNDTLIGEEGDDFFDGGAGNDVLQPGPGVDSYDGGSGQDTLSLIDGTQGAVVDLQAGQTLNDGFGNAETFSGIENALGTDFSDSLTGSGGVNSLAGNGGNDALFGLGSGDLLAGDAGDDTLDGGDGGDTLLGGPDNDTFIGGPGGDTLMGDDAPGDAGADSFKFFSLTDGGGVALNITRGAVAGDTILDFVPGEDGIFIAQAGFDPQSQLTLGALTLGQSFSAIGVLYNGTNPGANGNFAGGAPTFVFSTADSTLYFDDNGASAGYTVVATVANGVILAATDVVVAA